MKKLLLVALLAIVSVGASAQIEKGLRYGVQGVVGINTIGETGIKAAISYGLGFVVEQNFSENFYLETGLGLQDKGWKSDAFDKEAAVIYLTLPIHLGGRTSIGNNSYFHYQAGPQIAYGLGGSEMDFAGLLKAKYADWGKRFEFGAGAKVGVEFNKLQISLLGGYGFTKCMQGGGHNLNVTLGVTRMF